MKITKGEWNQWHENIVTQAFFEAAGIRVEDAKDVLAVSAGLEPEQDNFWRGFISAYNEMKEFKVEDLVDED